MHIKSFMTISATTFFILLIVCLAVFSPPLSAGAKEVKPGVVITTENYKDFPELKELLPESLYGRLKPDSIDPITRIKVVPTQKMRLTKGGEYWKEYNRKHPELIKYNADKDFIYGWKAGIPYPGTTDPHKLMWNFFLRKESGDCLAFTPVGYWIMDRKGRTKKVKVDTFYYNHYGGRTDLEPLGFIDMKPKVFWKNIFVASEPYDLAGFGGLRVRYWDIERRDDSWVYVPAVRRVRRMMSKDEQDPQLGSDNTLDDYATFFQKIGGHRLVPISAEKKKQLVWTSRPGYVNGWDVVKESKKREFFYEWEIRECWVLDLKVTDPNYMYSRRKYWMATEEWGYRHHYAEFYDQKERLWRTHQVPWWWDPETGKYGWVCVSVNNHLTGSKTFIISDCKAVNNPENDKDEFFDIKKLRMLRR